MNHLDQFLCFNLINTRVRKTYLVVSKILLMLEDFKCVHRFLQMLKITQFQYSEFENSTAKIDHLRTLKFLSVQKIYFMTITVRIYCLC